MPVANATPPLAVLERRFPGLGAGGVARPAHCRPSTSLAIVVPFRNREGQLRQSASTSPLILSCSRCHGVVAAFYKEYCTLKKSRSSGFQKGSMSKLRNCVRVFLSHMHEFLARQELHYRLYLVNQVSSEAFLR